MRQKKLFVVAISAVIVLLIGLSLSSSLFDLRRHEAWNAAIQFVGKRNLWPGQPNLPNEYSPGVHIEKLSEDRYRISAWAEGKNGYGVLVRQNWTCIAQYDGSGLWSIRNYGIADPEKGTEYPSTAYLHSQTSNQILFMPSLNDWLNYRDFQSNPNDLLDDGTRFDLNALLASGRAFWIPQDTPIHPLHNSLRENWLVEIQDGQYKGKQGWVSNDDVLMPKPSTP